MARNERALRAFSRFIETACFFRLEVIFPRICAAFVILVGLLMVISLAFVCRTKIEK